MKMTSKDFRQFRAYMGWTIERTARTLGKSTRTIIRYEQGGCIPPSIAMSCGFIAMRHVSKSGVKRMLCEFKRRNKLD